MHKYISLTFALLVMGGLSSQNVKEAIQNTKQISEGKQNLERDTKELAAFKAKLTLFATSYDGKDGAETNRLKTDIVADMVREVRQSGEKAKQARIELAQSGAEIRSERREIRRDRNDSEKGRFDRRDDERDLARDKANMRDDRRDRRDDKRDLEMQIARAERQAEILKTVKVYNFAFDGSNDATDMANRELINEFMKTMEADIEATKIELMEDNRERREDRRERRDDRNERKESDTKRKRRGWGN